MADRYWVGGTATWDATAGTKWSTTSGGAGGAAVPTAADDVFFNAASGAVTCTVSGSRVCGVLTCTGFTGTLSGTATPVLTISKDMILASGMTFDTTNGPSLVFNSTNNRTITSAGKTVRAVTFNGVGGQWTMQDAFASNGTVTLSAGALVFNGFTFTVNAFISTGTLARTITQGIRSISLVSTITADTVIFDVGGTNLTMDSTNVTINVTSSSNVATVVSTTFSLNVNNLVANTGTILVFSGLYNTINFTNFTASLRTLSTFNGTTLTFHSGMTLVSGGSWGVSRSGGTTTITTAGLTIPGQFTKSGAGTLQFQDAFTCSSNITHTAGGINANNFNVTLAYFTSANTNTRSITMGSGLWTLTGTTGWDTSITTGLTLTKGTANILYSNNTTTARSFKGGGLTYNKLTLGGDTSTSTTTFTGSNTFSELASTKTVAHTLLFTAGTTTTVGAFTITGTSGNVVTIGSVTAATHTLVKTGVGNVVVDYASISYSTASPISTWYAPNSTDGGNNTGWIFASPPSGNFFMLF